MNEKGAIMRHQTLWISLGFIAAAVFAHAQWLNYPTAGIPRTTDGKPNLSAPAPRTADGKPDISGLWQTQPAPPPELMKAIPGGTNGQGEDAPSQYFLNILSDYKEPEALLLPSAVPLFRARAKTFTKESPLTKCQPTALPISETAPAPYKIVQTPGLTLMLYERDTVYRQVYTDGRKLPVNPSPTWLGYSVGKWDGDTFVVESNGFNDKGWLDARGHARSEAMRMTERFHRVDVGHLDVQMTIDDPKTYTKPFTITLEQKLIPDSDLLESFCTENEQSLPHIVGN
jgi:hypothetical protein